jgi:hypothetical protein
VIKRIETLLIVLMLMVVLAAPVHAGEFQEASGEWCYIPTPVEEPKIAGDNVFVVSAEEATWSGTFVGTSEETGNVYTHKGDGFWLFRGRVHLEVTVLDSTGQPRSGELFMRVDGTRPDAFSAWEGNWLITGGTGELKNLRGRGQVGGIGYTGDPPNVPGCVTYGGTIHFEP